MNDGRNRTPVAVITGASSGIGAATARSLHASGYRVALLARRVDRITALADELGEGAVAIAADVTDRDAIVAAAEQVESELGGADVLVNNAGLMLLGPFSSEQREDYRNMIEVNLLGAITATEVFLDQIKDGGGAPGTVARGTHITHEATRDIVQQAYDVATVTPDEVAEIITFVLTRPRHLAINEILLRPADQQG